MLARLAESVGHFVDRRRTIAKTMGAGLFDAGFTSLSTLVVSFYAARVFEPSVLGAYALAFAAYILASNVANQFVFVPNEIRAVSLERGQRLQVLDRSLRLGLPVALLCAFAVPGWLLFASSELSGDVALGLTVTAIACAIVSPVQDHVRRMLHLADASLLAALAGLVKFLVISSLIAAAIVLHLPAHWIPLGTLATATLVSSSVGLFLARRRATPGIPPDLQLRMRDAFHSGRWLVIRDVLSSGANFVAAGLVTQLAGAVALGYAEAARICAQPIWVFVLGIGMVTGPRSMEAARARDRSRARWISRGFSILASTVGFGYLVVTAVDWWGNPLPELLPNAYVVPYLVALWVVANTLLVFNAPFMGELLGAGRESGIAKTEVWASVARTGVSAGARVLGPFAMPAGLLVSELTRTAGLRWRAERYYAEVEEKS